MAFVKEDMVSHRVSRKPAKLGLREGPQCAWPGWSGQDTSAVGTADGAIRTVSRELPPSFPFSLEGVPCIPVSS